MQVCRVCFRIMYVERLDSSHTGNHIVQYAIEVEPQDLSDYLIVKELGLMDPLAAFDLRQVDDRGNVNPRLLALLTKRSIYVTNKFVKTVFSSCEHN